MNNNLTEIVFILDRSGSMSGREADTIGGFNAFIEQQKRLDGEAKLTTILFDDKYEVLHDGVDIQDVSPLTKEQYYARGSTALLDAIGKAINTVQNRVNSTPWEEQPGKIIMLITTDGQENCSREYKRDKIKEMIKAQQDDHNWEIIFMCEDLAQVQEAQSYGLRNAPVYTMAAAGGQAFYMSVNNAVTNYRMTGDTGDTLADTITTATGNEVQQ